VKPDRVRGTLTLLLCLLVLVVVALGMWQSAGASAGHTLTTPSLVPATGSTAYVPPVPTTVPAVVTVPDPPKIMNAIPSAAPTTGGVEIVISGVHFAGATKVTFNSIPATSHTVVSDEKITAVAPAHTAGTCELKVVGPGGTSLPYSFTYVEAPATTEAPTATTVTPTESTEMAATTLAETAREEEGGLAGGWIALIIVLVVVVVGGFVYVLRKGSRKA
jgi:hypothetical protein